MIINRKVIIRISSSNIVYIKVVLEKSLNPLWSLQIKYNPEVSSINRYRQSKKMHAVHRKQSVVGILRCIRDERSAEYVS